MTPSPDEQLAWEARAGRVAAAAAVAAALLIFGGGIFAGSLIDTPRPDDAARLLAVEANEGGFLAAAIIRGLGTALLGIVLAYLYALARARRPQLPRGLGVAVLLVPILFGAFSVASQVGVEAEAARQFAAGGARSPDRARELLREVNPTFNIVGNVVTLAMVAAMLTTSVIAMRMGLLSRFMGLLGVVVAVLLPVPVGGLILFFWLGALGALFLGRWPGGRGPAWQRVEAIPWPRLSEQREEIERRRAEREALEAEER